MLGSEHHRLGETAEEVIDAVFPAVSRGGHVGQEFGFVDADLRQLVGQGAAALLVLFAKLHQNPLALPQAGQVGLQMTALVGQLRFTAQQGFQEAVELLLALGLGVELVLGLLHLGVDGVDGGAGFGELAFESLVFFPQETQAVRATLDLHLLTLHRGATLVDSGRRRRGFPCARLRGGPTLAALDAAPRRCGLRPPPPAWRLRRARSPGSGCGRLGCPKRADSRRSGDGVPQLGSVLCRGARRFPSCAVWIP